MGQSLDAYLAFGILLDEGEDDEAPPWRDLTYPYYNDMVPNPDWDPKDYGSRHVHTGNFVAEEIEIEDWETYLCLLLDPDQSTRKPDEGSYEWQSRVWKPLGLDTRYSGVLSYNAGTLLLAKDSVRSSYYSPTALGTQLVLMETDPDWSPQIGNLRKALALLDRDDRPQWWLWGTYG